MITVFGIVKNIKKIHKNFKNQLSSFSILMRNEDYTIM